MLLDTKTKPVHKKNKSESLTLLMIDDDQLILKILQDQLAFQGFDILTASHGKQAITLAKQHHIDLAICDMHMPLMNGLQVVHYFKQNHPTLPVVMLTVQNDTDSVVRAMKAGAFDYLTKPMDKDTLLLTIQKGLRHRQHLLKTQQLEEENHYYKHRLESMVFEKTAELERKNSTYRFLLEDLKKSHLETVQILSNILLGRDPYRASHYKFTHQIALELGQKMELTAEQLEHLTYAVYLKDIGEVLIESSILNKTTRLTSEEYKQIRRHPITSEKLLKKVSFFKPILPVVRAHHEWYNGTGYPDGLKGQTIPLLARIIHVADAYVAMTNERPYRSAITPAEALIKLKREAGIQFCPQVVEAFVTYYGAKTLYH